MAESDSGAGPNSGPKEEKKPGVSTVEAVQGSLNRLLISGNGECVMLDPDDRSKTTHSGPTQSHFRKRAP